ncbi:hypothetical protein Tco_1088919 [Tanacetum coccineum]
MVIWNEIKMKCNINFASSDWDDILRERNHRLFQNIDRDSQCVRDAIIEDVRIKLLSLKVKSSKDVQKSWKSRRFPVLKGCELAEKCNVFGMGHSGLKQCISTGGMVGHIEATWYGVGDHWLRNVVMRLWLGFVVNISVGCLDWKCNVQSV